jgi:hypothetical protein
LRELPANQAFRAMQATARRLHRAEAMHCRSAFMPSISSVMCQRCGNDFCPEQPARWAWRQRLSVWERNVRRRAMLWTIFVILLVLWLLGVVSSYTLGGFIHILLVIALVVLVIQLISGRRPVV